MLKNKMTRHESRRPRPNAVGPRVPAERLAAQMSVSKVGNRMIGRDVR